MKLVIQIPCLNEEQTLPATIADLPTRIPGIDEIEILVLDDGSTDRTREIAVGAGAHRIVSSSHTLGLGHTFSRGLAEAIDMGADVIVNTDGDNQYRGADVARLVRPILDRRADMVVGIRDIDGNPDFSRWKKPLQRLGSWLVRTVSGTRVADATSGFRSFSRRAATQLTLRSSFSHTLETLVQAGDRRLVVAQVPIRTNRKTRDSRLFRSNVEFIVRSLWALASALTRARPLVAFWTGAFVVSGAGLVLTFATPPESTLRQAIPWTAAVAVLAWGIGLLLDGAAMQRSLLQEIVGRERENRRASRRRERDASVAGAIFPLRIDRRAAAEDERTAGDADPARARRVAD
jgi:glycosyltransferase involved in cell wall biosynthesis